MTRDDVIRITETVLQRLSIEVTTGGFTNPNSRKISLLYEGDQVIAYEYFDVADQDEYEG